MTEQQTFESRAPRYGEYFRVNRDQACRGVFVFTRDDKGELYLIAPHMVPEIERVAPDRIERCMIFVAQNEDGETFIWPVPMPVPNDHPAYQAMDEWVCLQGMQ